MLKKSADYDDEELDLDFDEEEEAEVKPAKKGKKAKPAKKVKEKKQKPVKAKGGFFAGEAFESYQGKIHSIMYFVMSLACIPFFIPMIFFGGGHAKQARAYMAESGDTDGIGFLAAGKAVRDVATAMFFIGLIIVVLYMMIVVAGVSMLL